MPPLANVVAPPPPVEAASPTGTSSAPTPHDTLNSISQPFTNSSPQPPSPAVDPTAASAAGASTVGTLDHHRNTYNPNDPANASAASGPLGSSRPRRIADLAAMAASVLRPRDNLSTVNYIREVDLEATMLKRNKVGPNTTVYVKLESTFLSVLRNKSSPPRHRVNVRMAAARVDVERRELHVLIPSPGRARVIRLFIATDAEAAQWKRALEDALRSDINEHYTFGKTLGSGAYGDVVKAVKKSSKETRAVKIIKRSSNIKSHEHLDSEIQVMKSISHPNIVQTYQIYDLKRTIYIVMEYVPGGDLFDFVAQHESLSEAHGSQTIRSIFQAVEYLHRNSIVHRDLKPENILCANNSWPLQIKVSDFGFAQFIDPATDTDNTMRTQVGTVYFMAPEIIANKGHGPAVDSWACGVILYTILTGRLPFPGKNTTEYFQNVLKGKPLFPAVLWKDVSEDAKSLVKGLLNVDPNKRLTSLGALQHRWIAKPDASYSSNEIRRDRSNLHSRRRRLFKARKAIIAVAMANKFKATIPQVVDKVGDSTKKVADSIEKGVKKTADGIEEGLKEIASGVKKVGDGIGEGTKKVAGEIGENTKKVAENIAEGTKKVAEGIGTGVKKTADGIENGLKKTADGIETGLKKTADGIETGFKKTADGIESGLKKTGEGIKKTADGIETGFKKTADGLENGVKKTLDGLENGVKKTTDGIGNGVKKTGENFKRGLDKVKIDRSRDTDGERSNTFASNSGSIRGDQSRTIRLPFRRRYAGSQAESKTSSEPSRQSEVPQPVSPAQERKHISNPKGPDKGGETEDSRAGNKTKNPVTQNDAATEPNGGEVAVQFAIPNGIQDRQLQDPLPKEGNNFEDPTSSAEYLSAREEQSDNEEGWGDGTHSNPPGRKPTTPIFGGGGMNELFGNRDTGPNMLWGRPNEHSNIHNNSSSQNVSNGSSSGSNRPNLTLLSGLTLGLSDECMAGSSTRELAAVHGNGTGNMNNLGGVNGGNDGDAGLTVRQSDLMRKAAALLMATSPLADMDSDRADVGIRP